MFNKISILSNMDTGVILIAVFPLIIAFIFYLYYYFSINVSVLKPNIKIFKHIAEVAGKMQDNSIDNLSLLDNSLPDALPIEFYRAWQNMKRQLNQKFTEGLLPEASVFFREAEMLTLPSRRGEIKSSGAISVFLMIISVAASYTYDMMYYKDLGAAFVLGISCSAVIAILQIVFYVSDSRAYTKMIMAYQEFLSAFEMAVPTVNDVSASALLLEAFEKNQKLFEAMTDNISDSFEENVNKMTSSIDSFTKDAVLRVLSESMENLTKEHINPILADINHTVNSTMKELMRQQESGVKELAESFAQQLAETLKTRIDSLSDTLTDYQDRVETQDAVFESRINEQNAAFENRINALNTSLANSHTETEKWMEKQSGLLEKSVLTHDRMALLMELEQENREQMQLDLKLTSDSIATLKDQIQSFTDQSLDFSNKSLSAQQRFGEIVDGMTENIHSAMESAGKEIAVGINKAVADNAKAIEELAVQSQLLRDDYGRFFEQRDASTKQTIEDMDYQIQGMIGRMSEDIGNILDKAIRENGEILAQYRENTSSIAQSFEEQAMSLNLYAKEIHSDIAGLSENLNASVEKFSSDIKEGIEFVFTDFDKGMAELTMRISDTVESINDSVENLSKILKS